MNSERPHDGLIRRAFTASFLACSIAFFGCSSENTTPSAERVQAGSTVAVSHSPGGPIVIKSSSAEFDVLPTGYVQAHLLKDGKRLTLDEPDALAGTLQADGQEL